MQLHPSAFDLGSKDPIFDRTQQFIQSKDLDNEKKQEAMELASSLKRMGLQEEEDCASVTFGTVQYFHQESISQTGKEMLEQKFGIQAKAGNLDSSTLYNLLLLTNDTTFNSIIRFSTSACQYYQ